MTRTLSVDLSRPLSSIRFLPHDGPADMGKGLFDEFAYRMALAGGEHIIVGLVLLQDQPHPLHKVARMSPVAPGIEIAEEELLLQPMRIEATARVIFRVTKVSPRIDSR